MNSANLPAISGSYALQLGLTTACRLQVGRLGEFDLPAGEYIYLGSARGPGGLSARLSRHLAGNQERLHWHIDYLRKIAIPGAICYLAGEPTRPPLECAWSQGLAELPGASIPAAGFGASDCRSGCIAHLIHFTSQGEPQTPLLHQLDIRMLLARIAGAPAAALGGWRLYPALG
ncbi:MAG: GIY-YIG nuclease family protein [Chloroflexota bacterium]